MYRCITIPRSALCLKWFNGLLTPLVHSSVTKVKRQCIGLHYRLIHYYTLYILIYYTIIQMVV